MTSYTLGFCFDMDFKNVLLIVKNKPAWQVGKLNGLGGKLQEGEDPNGAMYREFAEETSNLAGHPAWVEFGRLCGTGWEVFLFYAVSSIPKDLENQDFGEGALVIAPVDRIPHWPVVPNLRYLIPMAINHAQNIDRTEYFEIEEQAPSRSPGHELE